MKKIIFILFILVCFVSCEKDVFTGPVDPPIPEYGKIFVSTNPSGYKIFIDDKNGGIVTPDTVLWLGEGNHKLTLKHNIFSDSSMFVVIKKSIVQNYNIDMMSNPRFYAKIFCSTIPSTAKIYLNDLLTNYTTPATIPHIYPGQYEIKFQKANCRDDSSTYLIKGGQYYEILRTLEDTSRTVSYRTNNSKISSNSVNKVVVDKFNNKWIGTVDHGLIKFDGKNWTSYENVGIFKSKIIQDLLIDKRGKLWIATSIGLYSFDGITWQSYDNISSSNYIIALEEDFNGNIWIAAQDQLIKYDYNTFKKFTVGNTNMPLYNLSCITSSKNGDIWVGTSNNGILRYDGKSWTNYLINSMAHSDLGFEPPKISDIIKDLIVDKNGILYSFHRFDLALEVRSALIRFDGTYWTELRLSLLFALDVESFYLDNDNNIWMALNGGLVKYNEAQPLKFYDSDSYGYFSKWCKSFSLDLNGDGWLSTIGAGIAKLKKGTF